MCKKLVYPLPLSPEPEPAEDGLQSRRSVVLPGRRAVDASGLDISAMGSMNNTAGGGGKGFRG